MFYWVLHYDKLNQLSYVRNVSSCSKLPLKTGCVVVLFRERGASRRGSGRDQRTGELLKICVYCKRRVS